MSIKIRVPVHPELIKKYRDIRDLFDSLDSYSVVSLLEHCKMMKPQNDDIIITFENGESTKPCCNDRCIIF